MTTRWNREDPCVTCGRREIGEVAATTVHVTHGCRYCGTLYRDWAPIFVPQLAKKRARENTSC